MKQKLQSILDMYFNEILHEFPQFHGHLILLTHILPDRLEFLSAMNNVVPIAKIIAIPYSLNSETLKILQKKYQVLQPSLNELLSREYMQKLVSSIVEDKPFVIVEIGGYFAPLLNYLRNEYRDLFVGIVEDTEAGHRRYENASSIPCPIISVARSCLKEAEDSLVGPSCVFTAEKIMREGGFPSYGKKGLVMGYGKVGRGIANTLSHQNFLVMIYDHDPIKRMLACAEGFLVPSRGEAIQSADIIFGATGEISLSADDFKLLKKGVILVSCSSKDTEFDLSLLKSQYKESRVIANLDRFDSQYNTVFLIGNGCPVNFLGDATIGPVIALIQGEIIIAIKQVIEMRNKTGIFEVNRVSRQELAKKWLAYFVDQSSGKFFIQQNTEEMH